MKKKIILIVAVVAILGIGLFAGNRVYRINQEKKTVGVTPVAMLNMGWWGDSTELYGLVTTDVNQEVFLNDQEIIKEVFVKEGDVVSVGTPLLSYDMSLTEIQLEKEKIAQDILTVRLEGKYNELNKWSTMTPIPENSADVRKMGTNHPVVVEPGESESITESETVLETEPITESETMPETEPISETEEPTQTDTEPQTETQAETEAPKALTRLDRTSKPIKGTGTAKDPFVFFCTEATELTAEFLMKMKGYNELGVLEKGKEEGYCFVLSLYENDKYSEKPWLSIGIKGALLRDYEEDEAFVVLDIIKAIKAREEESPSESESEFDGGFADGEFGDDYFDDFGDWGFMDELPEGESGTGGFTEGFTKKEIDKKIIEVQREIQTMLLDQKQNKLNIEKTEKKLEKGTVNSTIAGVVKTVGDPEKGPNADGSAFLVVSGEDGLYIKGSVSELLLDEIQPGMILEGNSWESGAMFTAEVREISEYPEQSDFFSGVGNPNVSYYPFMAFVSGQVELNNYEYVALSANIGGDTSGTGIYIPKAYVRESNGENFVYIADEEGRLKKQKVIVGRLLYGENYEIKSGLTQEDMIAFPYGKNIQEGVKTVEEEPEQKFYY